jgi:hypothetical protein
VLYHVPSIKAVSCFFFLFSFINNRFSINGENPCNPLKISWHGAGFISFFFPNSSRNIGVSFPCKEGFTGRLCSQCDAGFYLNGKQCLACKSAFKWQIPVVYHCISMEFAFYIYFQCKQLPNSYSCIIIVCMAFNYICCSDANSSISLSINICLVNGRNSMALDNNEAVSISINYKYIFCICYRMPDSRVFHYNLFVCSFFFLLAFITIILGGIC